VVWLKIYCSQRIEVRRAAQIKNGDEVVGNHTKLKVVKNKVAPPFRTTEFDIMYNEGISISGDLLDMGTKYGVINKSGNSYTFSETKLGVGRENAKNGIKADKKMQVEMRKLIKEAIKSSKEKEEK